MTEAKSPLDLLNGLCDESDYLPEMYLAVADVMLGCTQHECHPVIFENRERYAESLKSMALNPKNKDHQASLRTSVFLIYTLRRRLYL